MSTFTTAEIEAAAHAGHEANRAFCKLLGDDSHKAWGEMSLAERAIAVASAYGVLVLDHTPETSHNEWMGRMLAEGWAEGREKSLSLKLHPAIKPYSDLAPEQRIKNDIFCTVARQMGQAFWRIPK